MKKYVRDIFFTVLKSQFLSSLHTEPAPSKNVKKVLKSSEPKKPKTDIFLANRTLRNGRATVGMVVVCRPSVCLSRM